MNSNSCLTVLFTKAVGFIRVGLDSAERTHRAILLELDRLDYCLTGAHAPWEDGPAATPPHASTLKELSLRLRLSTILIVQLGQSAYRQVLHVRQALSPG